MSKYPKIIMDETNNSPANMTAKLTTEEYYDFTHHTHRLSDLIDDTEKSDEGGESYDDTEIRKLIEGKVDSVEGKSLIADSEIERLSKVDNYDDTEIRKDFDEALDDLFNKIMGITDEDSTTVDEAYNTLKEVSKYIKEDTTAAAEIINKIAAIEEALKAKVAVEEGKSLIADSEIERLSKVDNYDDTAIKEVLENKVDAEDGKSLVSDIEIERLAKIDNYDDTEVKESIKAIVQYDKETTKSDLVADNYIDKRWEPYYDEATNSFYANGVPITINEDPDNTNGIIITWGYKGSIKIADTSDLTVLGGGDGFITAKSFAHTKVTVNGGFVRSLFAGGCLKSVVDNAEIIINGGYVKNIYGGGKASDNRDGYEPSVVYNSKITMNDGQSNLFVGGSIGYGITENTTININGGTHKWVVAGGTNGATEHSEVNINGGTIETYISSNRGYVTDVEFNMSAGSINLAYCGAEGEGEADDGTIGSFKCNITGGTITTLNIGTDDHVVEGDTYIVQPMSIDKVSGHIADDVVTNISDELKNKLQ